ncbi:DNA primase catalytic subunit [Macrolepiota fuliginosa MF-IS2]|uniref:DNA primase n=1 Tax=Macrolepiota fuliginosa MF-IS2 TaxID=1400762 RepID=A0A9P6C212_9AGAR|nr:DNA primase catalytic subunit [Macrolepiota fuliginosa MF-IS2]
MSIEADYDHSLPEVMLTYYRRLYPFKSVFTWLNHDHTPTRRFTHREWAFTLAGDVYLRYNSFATAEDLKKKVCQLNPTRFEIGPVYSARPGDRKTVRAGVFQPLQRELVFDIDMTDYDPIRTCCSDAGICKRCWAFITAAVRVIDHAVRSQFGYEHLLWVYSGRRGIHLWISDREAMDLTDQERKAIVGWMTLINSGRESSQRLNVRVGSRPLPAHLQEVYETLSPTFVDLILRDQDLFATEDGFKSFLEHIPDEEIVKKLRGERELMSSSKQIWDSFTEKVKGVAAGTSRRNVLSAAWHDIQIYYTYPRLDAEVSKHRNHLLKAPFCIHPKTGRVCVPVDPERIEDFDPEEVPTVAQLLHELDSLSKAATAIEDGDSSGHHSDWEKTSLKPYVDMLNQHASRLMEKTRLEKRATGSMAW